MVLVHLGPHDYDVELTVTHTPKTAKPAVRSLADTFATRWSGDGGAGTAWNLIVTAGAGRRVLG
ncbi:hypothetical protein [Streptomyces sp. NPDC005435]|uniref:hypothetical protein n=1 Tax=Streptomyces sp. NPDC005435 TaxID=3154464 RepID=UPI003453FE8A